MEESAKHFVLVHGICHGAWCWYKLATLLRAAGHRVTAFDLGGYGVDPRRLNEMASISDYLQPLMEFMASLPIHDDEKVVLVGHNYGGLDISPAMERFPEKISVGVFITAYMPSCQHPTATLIQEVIQILHYNPCNNSYVIDLFRLFSLKFYVSSVNLITKI
ncbi:hypothetical protein ACSBR1_034531 [Camellia fascicularis]